MRSAFPLLAGLLVALGAGRASATDLLDGIFAGGTYGRAFISELHGTHTRIELGYNRSYNEFNIETTSSRFDRPVVEAHLGTLIPLYAIDFGAPLASTRSPWGISLALPVSVHVLEDMFEHITAPVINTDYRFGSPKLAAIRRFDGDGFVKNLSVSWLPIFHECTHLGDEITIYRIDAGVPITRINVSYEYTELQFTLNDPSDTDGTLHSLRGGVLARISNRGYGWFDAREGVEMAPGTVIEPSTHRFEYYLEYEFRRTSGFLASPRAVNFVSLEVGSRVRYGYPIYKSVDGAWIAQPVTEQMAFTFNGYLGWKFPTAAAVAAHRSDGVGVSFHFYRGPNPYGQLRNYPSYPFFAATLSYDL